VRGLDTTSVVYLH